MQLTVDKTAFQQAVSAVVRAVPGKTALEALKDIRLEAEGDTLGLSATDLEVAIVATVPATVKSAGVALADAGRLADLVPHLADGELSIRTVKRGQASHDLEVVAGSGATRASGMIRGLDPADFPALPVAGDEPAILLTESTLRVALNHALTCVATNDSRPMLAGVCIGVADGTVTLASCDGFRLSRVRLPIRQGGDGVAWSTVAHGRGVRELARLLGDGATDVEVRYVAGSSVVEARVGTVTVTIRTIAGTFPDVDQIIPTAFETAVTLDAVALRNAGAAAQTFSGTGEDAYPVQLRVRPAPDATGTTGKDAEPPEDGNVHVVATSPLRGDGEFRVPADITGPVVDVAISGQYLRQALAACRTPRVSIRIVDKASALAIVPVAGEDAIQVVMPMVTS